MRTSDEIGVRYVNTRGICPIELGCITKGAGHRGIGVKEEAFRNCQE